MQLVTPLLRLTLSTSQRRLRRDWLYTLCVLCSMSIVGVLTALSGSWLLQQLSYQNPYQHTLPIWSIRLHHQDRNQLSDDSQAPASALYQLMDVPELAPLLSLAEPQSMALQHDSMPEAQQLKVLTVMGNFWSLLPGAIVHGRQPHSDKAEIAISFAVAERLFGQAALALQQPLLLNQQSYLISAVLAPDFVAPGSLAIQQQPGMKIAVVLPFSSHMPLSDSYQRTLYLLATHTDKQQLQRSLLQLMQRLNIAQDAVLPVSLQIRSLHQVMDGGNTRSASAGFILALLLAVVTICSIALLSRVRFNQRRHNHFAASISGANRWQRPLFEYTEVAILAIASFVAGLLLLQLSYLLLSYNPLLLSLLNSEFRQLNSLLLLCFNLLAFGCLLLTTHIRAERSSGRGLAAKAAGRFSLTLLQGTQLLLALMALTLCLQQSKIAWHAVSSALALDVSDLYQLNVEYPPTTPSQLIAADLGNLKQRLLRRPEVSQVAISNAAALDLMGALTRYRGPATQRSELISSQGNTHIYRSERSPNASQWAELDYSLSVVATEPALFSMMQYRLLSGRVFQAEERDQVMLTPAAAAMLFPNNAPIIGQNVPGSGRVGPSDHWHNHLQVSGVMQSPIMSDPRLATLNMLGQFPTVFIAYHQALDLSALSSLSNRPQMKLIIQARSTLPEQVWIDRGSHESVAQTRYQFVSLKQELQQRLAFHLLSASAVLSLALAVLLTLMMVSYSNIRLAFQSRQAEFALRLTLGADEHKLSWWLIRQELLLVLVFSLLWVAVGAMLQHLAQAAALSLNVVDFINASILVLACCAVSGGLALRQALQAAPMAALREA